MKEIRITCDGAELFPLSSLEWFQGNFKVLRKSNEERLKRRIINDGMGAPFLVWKRGETCYVLDGHQRIKALRSLEAEGWTIPPLPVNLIEASDERDAKKKLLAIASHYGKINERELALFMKRISDVEEIALDLRFSDTEIKLDAGGLVLQGDDLLAQYEEPTRTQICCPNCGFVDSMIRFRWTPRKGQTE